MKKLIMFFLCFFATNAYASSADSGRCPWAFPILIQIDAHGIMDSYGAEMYGADGGTKQTYDSTFSSESVLYIVIDSTGYSLINDTFRISYTDSIYNVIPDNKSLTIVFAHGQDSIISLSYTELITEENQWNSDDEEPEVISDAYTFQISALHFNDTSIYSADSLSPDHQVLYTYLHTDEAPLGIGEYDDNYSKFTASAVIVTGLLRFANFSEPSAVSNAHPPNSLSIYSSNGSIACSFDVSDQARNLEIFSPLGIREASFTISPGQMEASLPHLPEGFYFVRLGGSIGKIYVGE